MRSTLFGTLFLIGISTSLISASTVSFTGSLANDNSVALQALTVTSDSAVTFRTYSYAGGVNGAGTIVPSGGFDPILDLFDSHGALIAESDDGGSLVPADPTTLQNFDVYLKAALPAGSYTVALAQYDNFANGPDLSAGFPQTSSTFTSEFGCSNGVFCDVTGANRTASWALDITTVSAASTMAPEPSVAALFAVGLSVLGIFRGRKLIRRR